jgi:hypothetical protein
MRGKKMTNKINLSLKKLKGLKPKGVKPKKDSPLEVLINIYNSIKPEAISFFTESFHTGELRSLPGDPRPIYDKIFEKIHKEDFDLSQKFIVDNVITLANYSFFEKTKQGEIQILATISGCLLDSFTQKSRSNNKHCIMHVDNWPIPFLFYGCNNIDTLIVDNHDVDYLLYYAGKEGIIKNLILRNVEGNHCLSDIGSKEDIDLIWVQNCSGDIFGLSIMDCEGAVNYLYAGDSSMASAFYGTSEYVGCKDISRFAYFENLQGEFLGECSRFNTVVVDNCNTYYLLRTSRIKNLILPNKFAPDNYTPEDHIICFNIHEQDQGVIMKDKLREQFKVETFKDLISKIDYKKPTQTEELIKKLRREYKTLDFGGF